MAVVDDQYADKVEAALANSDKRINQASLSRLAILWFRRYLEASRNSGAALSTYFTLSALRPHS